MAELEQELRALAGLVDFPPERDLAPAVGARLRARPSRRLRRRRALAIIVAALVVAIGVAFAVPPARSAILRFLGLESVTLIEVDELPRVSTGPAAYGRRIPLVEVERQAGFRPLLPDIGRPDAVYVDDSTSYVIFLYGKPGARLRLSESRVGTGLIKKITSFEQQVEPVRVGDAPGVWIEGPHVVLELERQPRLVGSALLWEREGLLLRLEGRLTKEQAVRIARTAR